MNDDNLNQQIGRIEEKLDGLRVDFTDMKNTLERHDGVVSDVKTVFRVAKWTLGAVTAVGTALAGVLPFLHRK